jgi:uncharacterized membrane protein YdjX (TVP38/TMEM64 family)
MRYRMKKKKTIISIIIMVFIVGVALFMYFGLFEKCRNINFDVASIKEYLLSYGNWSILVLMLIFAIKPLLLVGPISVLAIVAGLLYGPIYGTIYTMLGSFLSATVGFFVAKYLGSGFVSKLLKGKSTKIEGDIDKHGLKIIMFLRLAFIFPYDALSYAAGFSKMKYRHFIIGTLIGVAPEMFAYNFIGTSVENIFSEKSLYAMIVVLIVVLVTVYFRYKKVKNKK